MTLVTFFCHDVCAFMAVPIKREIPVETLKYYHPYYRDLDKGTSSFKKPPTY